MDRKSVLCVKMNKQSEIRTKKHAICRDCITRRNLKRYYENKDKLLDQRKLFCEKSRDKIFQRHNVIYTNFKEVLRSYVVFENR